MIEHNPLCLELYVDWAGDKIPIVDQLTGEVGLKASLFVAVCPYSGLMFVTAAADEKMTSWIDCHVKAWRSPTQTASTSTCNTPTHKQLDTLIQEV